MKKIIYALILPLVVVSGLVFANSAIKNETAKKSIPKPIANPVANPVPKPISAAEKEAAMKQWYTTPGGIAYKNWEASPEGKKVLASAAKINKHTIDSSSMEAVITSLSLPPGSHVGLGMMVRIDGEDCILSFGLEGFANEFQQLHNLKVNDKIIIKSKSVSHAPKYAYPIVRGDYAELEGKIMYKRPPFKGC